MTNGPFRGSEALARRDLTRSDLSRRFRRVYRDVYINETQELTAAVKAEAAWLATGATATLGGVSAAAVFGTRWLDAREPAELFRSSRRKHPGIVVHSDLLDEDEVVLVRGMRVTCPVRTAFDVGRSRLPATAIPILDALSRATGFKPADVDCLARSKSGVRGVRRLRALLPLVDGGAESPQETRLRLIVVRAGLPQPQTQIRFPDLRIRVDMGWPEWKVALEYDGVQHWADAAQRAWDIERIALLESAGWVVIRVSAAMLARPSLIVQRVREKLRAAGCPL